MTDERTALIVGAGIGGLAAGLSLRRAGWNIRVHERAGSPRELGFGLGLAPNALAALRELGVAEPVVRAGAGMGTVELRRVDGRLLRRFNLRVGLPAVVALRPDVHGALLDAVGEDALRLSSEAVGFTEDTDGVTVRFSDGTTDRGSIVIGADGVRSSIRRSLHPDEAPPRPSGFCAVRGVAYGAGGHLGDLSGVGYFGHGLEAATIRASHDAVYWFLSLRSRDVPETDPGAIVQRLSASFEPRLRAIHAATNPNDMRFDQLLQRRGRSAWGAGRVTTLGDAAHLLMPHTGQGAAQALEDAVALGLVLSSPGSPTEALRRYEAVRMRRTRAFVALGPRIARVTTTRNVAITAVRTLALRLTPESWFARATRGLMSDPHRELR